MLDTLTSFPPFLYSLRSSLQWGMDGLVLRQPLGANLRAYLGHGLPEVP